MMSTMSMTMTGKILKTGVLRSLGATALAVALVVGFRATASAQSVCTTHAEVIEQLGNRHSEAPVAIGLSGSGGVIEVFATSDGSTWTIIITMPDGTSCMMAAGEAWETLPAPVRGPKA